MSALTAANINQFWTTFNEACTSIREAIHTISAKRAYSDIKGLKEQIEELQESATVAAPSLPLYDIKRSQQEIESFKRQCKDLELELQPRQAFKFSAYTMEHFILKQLSAADAALASSSEAGTATSPSSSSSGSAAASKAKGKRTLAEIIRDREQRLAAADAAGESGSEAAEAEVYGAQAGGSFVIKGQRNRTILATADVQAASTDVAGAGAVTGSVQLLISKCEGIVVSVKTVLGSVRLEHLSHCRIYLAPTSTSCYVEGCTDCIICTSSHQLRIHNTSASHLYVRCNSHPIIEDCSGLGFAPYSMLTYGDDGPGGGDGSLGTSMARDLHSAGLDEADCWSNVVDFKWHKDSKSPNYHELPVEQFLRSAGVGGAEAGDVGVPVGAALGGAVLVDGWGITVPQAQGARASLPVPPQHHQSKPVQQQAHVVAPPTAPAADDEEDDDEM